MILVVYPTTETMARMNRRSGLYGVPTLSSNYRTFFHGQNSEKYGGKNKMCDESDCHILTQNNTRRHLLYADPRISTNTSSSNMTKQNELKGILKKDQVKYLRPSPSDVVFTSLDERDMRLIVQTYIKAIFSDKYQETETRTKESLIVYTILTSIKEKGGKCLRQCSSDQGTYYEVDDEYSMARIKKVLDQLKNKNSYNIKVHEV